MDQILEAVWNTAKQLDFAPKRLWFRQFMERLPEPALELAMGESEGSCQLRAYVMGICIDRFERPGWKPGDDGPIVDLTNPNFDRYAQIVETSLALESLRRRGDVSFTWPEGAPLDGLTKSENRATFTQQRTQ